MANPKNGTALSVPLLQQQPTQPQPTFSVLVTTFDAARFQPIGYRCLVEVERIAESTPGKIILPQATRDAVLAARTAAIYVRGGDAAFTAGNAAFSEAPRIGSPVVIAKYAGDLLKDGATGRMFRYLNDQDVIAVLEDSPCDEYMQETDGLWDWHGLANAATLTAHGCRRVPDVRPENGSEACHD